MKSLVNRKGDVTITTVILIVLGLVVLVMLILGFTKGTDFFFKIFSKGPSDLQSLVEACSLQVSANLNADFCKYQLTDILGDEEVVNCEHPLVTSGLNNKGVIIPLALTDYCAANKATFLAKVCNKIGESKREQTKINGGPGNCETGVPASLILSKTDLSIKGEGTETFSVALSSKPSSNVEIGIAINPSELLSSDKTALTFTSDNWNVAQVVKLTAGKFDSAKRDVSVSLTGADLNGKVDVTIMQ